MEASPLTQQARPDVFEPKIVQLYTQLFRENEDEDKSEGFWSELFLLKPDITRLGQILDDTDPEYLLHTQHHCQHLIQTAAAAAKAGKAPADEHALETLAVFLNKVLSKKYQSPSADIIEVLAGLDNVDAVFTDLVATLDEAIRNGRNIDVREKAVQVAVALTSGAFQTGLLTYFTQQDLFPALMKLVCDAGNPSDAILPLLLSGLLANYNKFETHNPYQARFANYTSIDTIAKNVACLSATSDILRDRYTTIQNDLPEGWSFGGTLSYVGLGSLAGVKSSPPALTEEEMKAQFAEQPQPEVAVLLSLYEFVQSNKTFCIQLVTNSGDDKQPKYGLAGFLSFSSYLFQHAHRSSRAASYARLVLIVLRILQEDPQVAKRLCESSTTVRLCRQRQPYLPLPKGERPFTAILLDVMVDCINHNLRTKLDISLYSSSIGIIIRICSYLSRTRTKLAYHWPELWRSLLSFVRFLTQYVEQLQSLPYVETLAYDIVNLITLCLTQGELFLPDSASLDDLFYKIVESSDQLIRFREIYQLTKSPVASNIGTLIGASEHFKQSLNAANGKSKNVSPREVQKAIKTGYETLSLEAREGTDHWVSYREQDHKAELKRITRIVAGDARVLGMPSG